MKQKGFTLIELLAVLVILALVAIVTSSLVNNTIDKAKVTITKAQEESILKAAEKWSVDNSTEFDDIESKKIQVGLDVVFILDISTSMNSSVTGSSTRRFIAMVDAVNASMDILEGENNRQAVYMYSTSFYTFLPLANYTSSDGKYLTTTNKTSSYSSNPIKTSTTLRKNGAAMSQKSQKLTGSTNTQKGIYQGTKLLLDTSSAEASERIPVVILLTDGLPNSSSSSLCKSCSSSGRTATGLSNHYYYALMAGYESKKSLASHYSSSADVFFYTIGLGISTSDTSVNKVLNPGAFPQTSKYNYVTKAFINSNMTAEELKSIFLNISTEVVEATKVVQVCVSIKDLYDQGYLSKKDFDMADGEAASTYVIMNYNEATNQYNFNLAKTEKQKSDCEKLLSQS